MTGPTRPIPHELLGVDPDATAEEVRAAFAQLSERVDPATGGSAALHQMLISARDSMLSGGSPTEAAVPRPPTDGWEATDEPVVEDLAPGCPVTGTTDNGLAHRRTPRRGRRPSSRPTPGLGTTTATAGRGRRASGPWKTRRRLIADVWASIPTPHTWQGWVVLLLAWPVAEWFVKTRVSSTFRPVAAFVLPWIPAILIVAGVIRWWRRRNGWDFWGTRTLR